MSEEKPPSLETPIAPVTNDMEASVIPVSTTPNTSDNSMSSSVGMQASLLPTTNSNKDLSNKDLQIHPHILHFPPPLNRVITNILKFQNTSSSTLAFKIRTNRPIRYSVKPHVSTIAPGEQIEVLVRFNPQKEPITNLKERDKFQVQSFLLTEEQLQNLTPDSLGNLFKTLPEESFFSETLKCRFAAVMITKPNTNNMSSTTTEGAYKNEEVKMNSSLVKNGNVKDEKDEVEKLKERVIELTNKTKELEKARETLINRNKKDKENLYLGIPKSAWYMIIVVGAVSFVLGVYLL